MLNNQKPSKVVREFDGQYSIHSIFETIQGEGPFCGTPSVFIRLYGCNLQCPMCDTEYTSRSRRMTPEEIVAAVGKLRATGLVVVTGGEPFRQPIGELLESLFEAGYYVQVETNGTLRPPTLARAYYRLSLEHPLKGIYVVCSPKTGYVHPMTELAAVCYKYVLAAGQISLVDGLPHKALGHVANPILARPPAHYPRTIYVQPEDSQDEDRNKQNLQACIESAMRHGYTIQLQIHKILGME